MKKEDIQVGHFYKIICVIPGDERSSYEGTGRVIRVDLDGYEPDTIECRLPDTEEFQRGYFSPNEFIEEVPDPKQVTLDEKCNFLATKIQDHVVDAEGQSYDFKAGYFWAEIYNMLKKHLSE